MENFILSAGGAMKPTLLNHNLSRKIKEVAKYVYYFGDGKADGNESMKNLLGGKGANLAEMAGHKDLKLPVPPGFTITTEVCTYYYQHKKKYPQELQAEVSKALKKVESLMSERF